MDDMHSFPSEQASMASVNNSIVISSEFWFIAFDIVMIVNISVTIFLATLFLVVIALNKTCHTTPVLLVANSCLAKLLLGFDILGFNIFTLHNDLKQMHYQDSLCILRCYLGYVLFASQNYSYLLSSIYRFVTVVYPARLFWRLVRTQFLLIASTWIFAFVCPLPFLLSGEIIYDVDNQICQIPLQLSFSIVFLALCIYAVPLSMITLIYLKLVRYVKKISHQATPGNTLFHAQRELKMVRRIVILVGGATLIGLPYSLFMLMSFFTKIPKYHLRIAYIFISVLMPFLAVVIFVITDPLKKTIMKRIKRRPNVIAARIS